MNPDLAFLLPERGALRWVDSLTVPIDAPRPEKAYEFISFYLEPEVAAGNSTFVRVDTGNAAAAEFIPEDVLGDAVIFPPESVLDALVFTADLGEDEELYETGWERVQET